MGGLAAGLSLRVARWGLALGLVDQGGNFFRAG